MFIAEVVSPGKKNKKYRSLLLRESYREGDRVKSRTLLKLTGLPSFLVQAIRQAVETHSVGSLEDLPRVSAGAVPLQQRESFGAVWAVHQIAVRLGLDSALGVTRPAELALWQVLARVLSPGTSLLGMVRLASGCAAAGVLGWKESFTEDHLYANGAWIVQRQPLIEKRLWNHRKEKKTPLGPELFLYDVTSSYLEGSSNALGEWGYSRDGKKGKKQVVVGLLTDETGDPCSVRVYPGNTRDLKTFAQVVDQVKEDFHCEGVTLVGDRGMIRSDQIEEARQAHFHFITALTKPQIKSLLKTGVFQMELFDEELGEVITEADQKRYVLRRNPARQREIAQTRLSKKARMQRRLQQANAYLAGSGRRRPETQLRKAAAHLQQLELKGWLRVEGVGRELVLQEDGAALAEQSQLDGCYVIHTDLTPQQASAQVVHDRYKDLAKVERDFRTLKTGHLEMRPWFVTLEDNTHAHAVTVMLALKIRRYLELAWWDLNLTVEEGLRALETFCVMELGSSGQSQGARFLPRPDHLQRQLLDRLDLRLPEKVPAAKVIVGTRVNLAKQRKPPSQ